MVTSSLLPPGTAASQLCEMVVQLRGRGWAPLLHLLTYLYPSRQPLCTYSCGLSRCTLQNGACHFPDSLVLRGRAERSNTMFIAVAAQSFQCFHVCTPLQMQLLPPCDASALAITAHMGTIIAQTAQLELFGFAFSRDGNWPSP